MLQHLRRRFYLATAVIVTLALALAACGPTAPAEKPKEQPPAAPVEKPKEQAAAAPAAKPKEQGPTTAPAPPAAQKTTGSAEFQKIVEGAKQEGEFAFFGRVPLRESLDKMLPIFNKRFGTNLKINIIPMDAREVPTRIIAESKQPAGSGDVGWGQTGTALSVLLQGGVLAKYPWVETFGQELPGIKERFEGIQEPFRGGGLEAYHATYGIFYNTKTMKREDLPKTWEQIGDPKWSGQFANDPAGSAYTLLGEVLSEQQVLDIVAKVKANKPIVTQAASDSIQRVIAQQALFGVGPVDSAEAEKLKGAPIDWVLLDPVGAAQTAFFTTPNPPHPNAARLFTAWLATEGLSVFEEIEGRGQVRPGSGFKMAKIVEASNYKVSMATTPDAIARSVELGKKVAKAFSE